MKRILITGGAGFIGSHLIKRLLDKNFRVLVFDNMSLGKEEYLAPYLNNDFFSFVKLDLLDKEKLFKELPESIDTVFHLAANSDISKGSKDTAIDFQNTTVVTFNLLEAMRKKRIKKIFYTSGSGVYGNVGTVYTGEDYGPLFPVSIYAASKLSAEAYISAYVHLFDMQAWIVRPANIIGSHSTHGVIFDFIKKLNKNPKKLKIYGDGKQSKSYIHIDDVMDAFFLIWQNSSNKINLFNLTTNDFITVTEIAESIIRIMNLKNVELVYSGGQEGWKGDVPVVRLKEEAIKKIGWKRKYNTRLAVEKTIQELLCDL